MFDSAILEVTIGLIFIFLILALMCSAIHEMIATFFTWRSKTLKDGIKTMLSDPDFNGLAKDIFNHPLVKALAKENNDPSYISARTFTVALLDVIKAKNQGATQTALQEAEAAVAKLPQGDLKNLMAALIDDAQGNLDKVRENIEYWFDETMDRVSGWYKRKAKRWTMGVAVLLTIAFSVDTIEVTKSLWLNPILRQVVSQNATKFYLAEKTYLEKKPLQKKSEETKKAEERRQAERTRQAKPGEKARSEEITPAAIIRGLRDQLNKQRLPIGLPQLLERWNRAQINSDETQDFFDTQRGIFIQTLIGWLLTALAVSVGAPFWFDMLGKFINLRGAGVKPTSTKPA